MSEQHIQLDAMDGGLEKNVERVSETIAKFAAGLEKFDVAVATVLISPSEEKAEKFTPNVTAEAVARRLLAAPEPVEAPEPQPDAIPVAPNGEPAPYGYDEEGKPREKPEEVQEPAKSKKGKKAEEETEK